MIDEASNRVTSRLLLRIVSDRAPTTFTYTTDRRDRVYLKLSNYLHENGLPKIHIVFPSRRHRKMVAYTDETGDIYINGRRNWTVSSLTGAIMHELCHIVGYGHGGNWITFWNKRKKYASVPYAVGKLFKQVCEGK